MGAYISVNHVTKKFKEATVLNDVNVEFKKAEIHGLIGRNGSGKTMLMKCICGLVPITKGTIIINQKQIGKDVQIPDNIGAIIETPGFLPSYSGYQNLLFLSKVKGTISKEQIKQSIRKVGLNPEDKKPVGKYSLGMRQRLGLAQAIMENPELLILDEPMNGLDKEGVSDMRTLLLELKEQGKTILIASHSTEDIEILCDTVCKMDKGVLTKLKGW